MAGPNQKRQKLGHEATKTKQPPPPPRGDDDDDEFTNNQSLLNGLGPEAGGLQPLVFSLDAIVALHNDNKPLADALSNRRNCPSHLSGSPFYKSLATSKSISSVPYQGRTKEENAAIAELSAYNKVISAASLEFAVIQKAHNRLTAEYNARHTSLVKIRDQLRTRVRNINEEMQHQLDSTTASPNLSSSEPPLHEQVVDDENSKTRKILMDAGILPAYLHASQNATLKPTTTNPQPLDADALIHHRDLITTPSLKKNKKKKNKKKSKSIASPNPNSTGDDSSG